MSIYKGGYVTIDMLDEQIGDSDAPATIPGIFSTIREAWGKVVVYKDINLQGQTFDMLIPVGTVYDTDHDTVLNWLDPLGTVVLVITNENSVYIQT